MNLIFCYDLEWFHNGFCTLSQQLRNMQHHITILHCHNSAQSCVRYCHNYIYSHTNHRVMKRHHFKGHSAGESKLSGHLFKSLLFLKENLWGWWNDLRNLTAAALSGGVLQVGRQDCQCHEYRSSLGRWFHTVSIRIDFLEGSDDVGINQLHTVHLVA